MGKYIVVVESEKPPQIFIHDDVPNIGKVLEIKAEEIPNRVPASWLILAVMGSTFIVPLLSCQF